ncbi:MAG: hypothetical protein MK240_10890, partial [Opitutales bacterium]|nr:hypothetical protein [Opitutales bacterium]
MVLQAGKPNTVWGKAGKNATVTVRFGDDSVSTMASKQGDWKVQLPKTEKSFDAQLLIIEAGTEQVTFKDVLVGEVWICGGQSNMAWTMNGSRDGDLEIASANADHIRFMRVPLIARNNPQSDFPVDSPTAREGNWRKAITEQVDNCTAVGYYFAQRIGRLLKTPVGLIDVSWGGTMAQHWVTDETLSEIPEIQPYHQEFEAALKDWIDGGGEEGAKIRFEEDVKEWEVANKQALDRGERAPRRPNSNDY